MVFNRDCGRPCALSHLAEDRSQLSSQGKACALGRVTRAFLNHSDVLEFHESSNLEPGSDLWPMLFF